MPSKRGICVPWNFEPADFELYKPAIESGRISWVGNWEMWKPKGIPENVTYVPQCRTANEANQIRAYLDGYKDDNQAQDWMGFNEPDIESQANLSVEDAVKLWKEHVLPTKAAHPGVRIGSPGISNAPEGINWLKRFFIELGGTGQSGVDHVVIHYYSPDVEHFKVYVQQVHNQFKLPVWVTEFGCTRWDPGNPPSEEEVLWFMREALNFLDSAPYVERYAWFGSMRDVGEGVGKTNGLQQEGGLSEAGKLYTSL